MIFWSFLSAIHSTEDQEFQIFVLCRPILTEEYSNLILNEAPLVEIINRGKISRFHALLAAGALLSFINYSGGLISQDRELT